MTFRQKYLKSFDGTRIGYQIAGTGKTAFVLCNGLGGSAIAWSPITHYFKKHFRFITWDYRGLFTSAVPENRATLAIPYHVMDLEAILKKEKISSAVVGGWSMGVQVALEIFRARPKFTTALFLLNGTSGYPLKTAFNSPLTRYVVPLINMAIKRLLPPLQPRLAPVARRVIRSEEFIKVIVGLGLIHRNFNTKILRQVAEDIIHTNLAVYHEVLDHLCVHDASDMLARVNIPTLIVGGGRDILTPQHVAERMARAVKKAELFIVTQGSHYSLMEFPDIINRRLAGFLSEHGFMRTAKRCR